MTECKCVDMWGGIYYNEKLRVVANSLTLYM